MTDALDKQVAFASVQHDVLAKEIQLQQLSKANQLLKTQQDLAAKESLNQKLIMAWLALLLGLLVFWAIRAMIKRKKLETLVELDHLTKILNRKGLEDHVGQLLSRKAGQKVPVHLAIMDLDHFKKVNDDCGHLTGDWVLKYVIYHIKNMLSEGMILGRLGVEEFVHHRQWL
jgi:FOG: GGDEF domain